jgi:hypothetical protein
MKRAILKFDELAAESFWDALAAVYRALRILPESRYVNSILQIG